MDSGRGQASPGAFCDYQIAFGCPSSTDAAWRDTAVTWTLRPVYGLWNRSVAKPLAGLSLEGASAETIALSVALGLVFGMFPVYGCPTLLCAAAAIVLRLNSPAVQLVNYLISPLQLALLVPFNR